MQCVDECEHSFEFLFIVDAREILKAFNALQIKKNVRLMGYFLKIIASVMNVIAPYLAIFLIVV